MKTAFESRDRLNGADEQAQQLQGLHHLRVLGGDETARKELGLILLPALQRWWVGVTGRMP
jgi:hypothetical protein